MVSHDNNYMLVSTGLRSLADLELLLQTCYWVHEPNGCAFPHTQEGPAKSAEVLDDCSGGSLVSRRPALDTMPHRSPGLSRELTHEISSA